jgi:hypothetical protein
MCSMSVHCIIQKHWSPTNAKRVFSSIVTHSYMFRPCWVIFSRDHREFTPPKQRSTQAKAHSHSTLKCNLSVTTTESSPWRWPSRVETCKTLFVHLLVVSVFCLWFVWTAVCYVVCRHNGIISKPGIFVSKHDHVFSYPVCFLQHGPQTWHIEQSLQLGSIQIKGHGTTRHDTTRQNILLWLSRAWLHSSPSPTANDKDSGIGIESREYFACLWTDGRCECTLVFVVSCRCRIV